MFPQKPEGTPVPILHDVIVAVVPKSTPLSFIVRPVKK
jgi:hypothetical protein